MNEDKNTFKPADFSDAGNAAVFVREHCDDIIFTDSMGWLCWDGKRWERNEHKALELAEDFSEHMLRDAMGEYRDALHNEAEAKAADPEGSEAVKAASEAVKRSKAYLAHANMTRRVSRLKAILDLARPYMVRPGNSMDADPLELNTQAGIINLVTGAFRPNQQEAYCTKVTAFSRNDKGKDIWDSFLDTITCENSSLKGFLQMVVGMSLFGKVYQEGVTFAVGTGKNGKSTFFNKIAGRRISIVEDTPGVTRDRIYADCEWLNHKFTLIDTGGIEPRTGDILLKEEGRRLSAATIKKISSTDPFQVEEKYKQPEIVKPSHTLCLFTNHLPRVGSTDEGTWRRIFVVPFNAVIQPDKTIQNYADYLAENAGGFILAWAVEGAQNFARNGFRLDIPDCVEEATYDYRSRENWLENFLSECCIKETGAHVGARELYDAYKAWSEALKDYTRSEKDFSAEMEKLGISKRKSHGINTYFGLRLNDRQNRSNRWYDNEIL